MTEQDTGWRDIKTNPPKETREDILCYEPPIAGPYPSPARRYVSSGYALKHQYLCGTEDENPTHWQPLPPPPGEDTAEYRNQVIQELIEKALGDAAEICQERYLPDERAKALRYLSEWLKSQMEGE